MQRIKMRSSTRDRIIVGMDANLTSEPRIDKEWGSMEMEDMELATKSLQQKERASAWLKGWAEESDMMDI